MQFDERFRKRVKNGSREQYEVGITLSPKGPLAPQQALALPLSPANLFAWSGL